MNKLNGKIKHIEVSGSMSLVSVAITDKIAFKTIIIETPETASYLSIGNEINILFKETEVIIGTAEEHNISLQNRISGKIKSIEKGSLISKITLSTAAGEIVSIISTSAVSQLNLKEEMTVMAMVKLNEIMLSE